MPAPRAPDPFTRAVAIVVKVMRIAHGKTARAFAFAADISEKTLLNIETGENPVTIAQLRRIAAGFGTDPDLILKAANISDDEPLDTATKTDLARKAIELAGATPDTIHHPLIDRLLRRNPRKP